MLPSSLYALLWLLPITLLSGCYILATRDYEGKLVPVFDPVQGQSGNLIEAALYGVPVVGTPLALWFNSYRKSQQMIQSQQEVMEKIAAEPDENKCLKMVIEAKKKTK